MSKRAPMQRTEGPSRTRGDASREPAAVPQSPLQRQADGSPRVHQLAARQQAMDGSPRVGELVQRNRTGMPDSLKAGLEDLSGVDLSQVRVHYNSSVPTQLQANAYAQGNEIHLGRGQEKHLPHEGWHVVQQMKGRVKPTLEAGGVKINDNPGLEKEADVMGARASRRFRSGQ